MKEEVPDIEFVSEISFTVFFLVVKRVPGCMGVRVEKGKVRGSRKGQQNHPPNTRDSPKIGSQ